MDVSYVASELLPGRVVLQEIFSSVCFLEADQQRKALLKYAQRESRKVVVMSCSLQEDLVRLSRDREQWSIMTVCFLEEDGA